MTLHVRYSSHLDLLADELAEQLADTTGRPVRTDRRRSPHGGRSRLADPAPRRATRRRGQHRDAIPRALPGGRARHAARRRRPVGGRPVGVGRARRARLGRRRRAGLARGSRRAAVATVRHGSAHRRPVRPLRHHADRRSFSTGAAASPATAPSGAAVGGGDDADGGIVRGIDPASQWQFDLWRAVRERVGEPSPAERLPDLARQLRAGAIEPALPTVVAMFGVGALAPTQLEVIASLAAVRDVTLSVVTPSAMRLDARVASRSRSVDVATHVRRALERRGRPPPHRLLGSPRHRDRRAAARGRALRPHARGQRRRSRRTAARHAPRAHPARHPTRPPADAICRSARVRVPGLVAPGPRLPRRHPPARGAARRPRPPVHGRPRVAAERRAGALPRHRPVRAVRRGGLRPWRLARSGAR